MQELVEAASTKLDDTKGTVTQHGTTGRSSAQNAMDLVEALTALVALLDGVRNHLDELTKLLGDLAEG